MSTQTGNALPFGIATSLAAVFLVACSQQPRKQPSKTTDIPAVAPPSAKTVASCKQEDDRELCKAACESGSNQSCAFLGVQLLQAGMHEDAERPLVQACNAEVALGCGGLGSLHGLRKDWVAAKEALETGCSLGDGLACESLGGVVQGANGAPQPTDVTTALKAAVPLYRKACDLGATRGCGWVAAAISDGAVQGSLKDALDLYVKACSGGAMPMACRHAVGLFHKGTPESQQLASQFDAERLGEDLLSRGCKLGDRKACDLLQGQPAK